MTLLRKAVEALRQEYESSGKLETFEALKMYLGGQDRSVPYRDLAEQLNSTVGAIRVAVHRLRQRCQARLRDEIAQTVASEDQIDDELNELFRAVSG
jgi:RNA polymerase sigma-70 factor (ECF subfamily)